MVWNLWVKIIKSYYLRKHMDYQNSIKSPEIWGGGCLYLNKVFTGLSSRPFTIWPQAIFSGFPPHLTCPLPPTNLPL